MFCASNPSQIHCLLSRVYSRGFNILLHGLGSKRKLMEDFRETMLGDYTHLVVNGYFPSLTIKSVSLLSFATCRNCKHKTHIFVGAVVFAICCHTPAALHFRTGTNGNVHALRVLVGIPLTLPCPLAVRLRLRRFIVNVSVSNQTACNIEPPLWHAGLRCWHNTLVQKRHTYCCIVTTKLEQIEK